MESTKGVLKVKNSGIPRPSKLVQPTTVNLSRKRTASNDTSSLGKENVSVKRQKLDTSSTVKTATTKKVPSSRTTIKATAAKQPSKAVSASKRATTTKAPGKNGSKVSTGKSVSGAGGGQKTGSAGSSSSSTGGGGGKTKRAAWDLKGRLQDMESLMANERMSSTSTIGDLKSQLEGFVQRLEDLEGIRQQQESTIQVKLEENTVASTQIKELEENLSRTKQKLLDSTRSYEHELEMLRLSKASLQRSRDELESDLTAARAEVTSLKKTVAQMAADASGIQCQLDATKAARDQAMDDCRQKSAMISELESQVADHLSTIEELRSKDVQNETIRRKLHNTIQELKGNIRVFCRVRPPLPGEAGYHRDSTDSSSSSSSSKGSKVNAASLHIGFPDEASDDCKKLALQVSDQSSSSLSNNSLKSYNFEFDRVFGPSTSQQSVFEEISQLVQSALDGYNVCIFAYGQTGSGKTFTMEGPPAVVEEASLLPPVGVTEDRRGMIPRAVEQVFTTARGLREKGWEYTMEASFLEIYNETIRDLLSSSSTPSQSHDIKRDPHTSGEVYVTNLTPVAVTSEKQVESLLERAAKNRAVAATLCNERSSRSHSVFRLKLTGKNEGTGESCRGTLNLIDLAGSERLTSSGSVGERLKETKNINKSLSNLGNVIMALANKDQHVPYRNSKLTYLLQNSLGGNSKTLMFVNISPRADSYQETLCSLRFATKVNQCNIGTARKAAK